MKMLQKNKYWLIGIPSILLIIILAAGLYLFLTDDLLKSNMASGITYRSDWEIPSLSEQETNYIHSIFQQPFSYLSEGGQSCVFESQDQHYVLKIIKFQRLRPSWLIKSLPDNALFHSLRMKHIAKKERKFFAAFIGYKLAYTQLRSETGLIHIQLNPSQKPLLIYLTDKWGFKRVIDIGQAVFIIQEKGEMLGSVLTKLLEMGHINSAKAYLDQLFSLYLSEYRRGIYDLDYGVMHNIGVARDRLFHLDPGKLVHDERIKQPILYQADLVKVALKIHAWVRLNHPEYDQIIANHLEERLTHLFSKSFSFTRTDY